MAKNNLGFISYTSNAALHLVRGVIYDVQKSLTPSVAAKPMGHNSEAMTQKIFLKSEGDDSEFVLDVTYVSVNFSVGHKIEAIIDKSEDIYFLRNLNLDTDFLANADTAALVPLEHERPKFSDVTWVVPFIIGGIFLAAVFSSKFLVILGWILILAGVFVIAANIKKFSMNNKVNYVRHMADLVGNLTSKTFKIKTITWPRPDGRPW